MNNSTKAIITLFLLFAGTGISAAAVHMLLGKTLWGYRRRGRHDARKGGARTYEEGWTSPFVEQIAKRYAHRLARLTHHAERRQAKLYEKVSAMIAEVEKLNNRLELLAERYNTTLPYETENEEIRLRWKKRYYVQSDHIGNLQADLAKKLSGYRTRINTHRQRYLQKVDMLINKRNERLNAYWAGVCNVMDDAPVTPEYDQTMPGCYELYIRRNDRVLDRIDFYTEHYLKPEDAEKLEV